MILSKEELEFLNEELQNKIVETRELLEDARRDKDTELSSYYSMVIFMSESILNKI